MPHDCITMQTFSVTGAASVNRIKKNEINRQVFQFYIRRLDNESQQYNVISFGGVFLENKTVVCHCLVRFVGINRAHGCVRTVNLSVSDVAKPNQQCMQFVQYTRMERDSLMMIQCCTRHCWMDLPPYERIMWARANTGQRPPYCDLRPTFDSRLYCRCRGMN